MAQTKKKRTRKHRGTPAGTVERAGRTGRPRTREEAKKIARQRRAEKLDKKPTWRGSINRAGIAAVVLAVILIALLRRPVAEAAGFAAFAFFVYIPLGYGTDLAIYRFRQRRKVEGRK